MDAHAHGRARHPARALFETSAGCAIRPAGACFRMAGRTRTARAGRPPCTGVGSPPGGLRLRRALPVRKRDDPRPCRRGAGLAGASARRRTRPAAAPAARHSLGAGRRRAPLGGRDGGAAHPRTCRRRCRAALRMRADPQWRRGICRRPRPLCRVARPVGRGAAADEPAAVVRAREPQGVPRAVRGRSGAGTPSPAAGTAERIRRRLPVRFAVG